MSLINVPTAADLGAEAQKAEDHAILDLSQLADVLLAKLDTFLKGKKVTVLIEDRQA